MNLVPIKVKIGLASNGYAKYPDFNLVSSSTRNNLDWAKYVDAYGLGWQYDKTSGHKEETVDSPFGQQWGVLIVPKEFADSAISLFPSEVTKLDETELEDFYDNKAHAHEADEIVDEAALKVFETKEAMKVTLTTKEETLKAKALDPEDDTPGIRKNLNKKWADAKVKKGVTIVE